VRSRHRPLVQTCVGVRRPASFGNGRRECGARNAVSATFGVCSHFHFRCRTSWSLFGKYVSDALISADCGSLKNVFMPAVTGFQRVVRLYTP